MFKQLPPVTKHSLFLFSAYDGNKQTNKSPIKADKLTNHLTTDRNCLYKNKKWRDGLARLSFSECVTIELLYVERLQQLLIFKTEKYDMTIKCEKS